MKAACTVWTGAKDSKGSDLSVFLFRYPYSADFFYKLWKRIRKYNGLVTGLTQNVEELARLLHISETQLSYITNVAAGCGLIRCAGNIVPFENSFPRHTHLYRLMTTKPDEVLRGG